MDETIVGMRKATFKDQTGHKGLEQNRCLSCGASENLGRRRYCSISCRQRLRQKLNVRTGLLRALNTRYAELGRTLGEELLEPHRSYYNQLKPHILGVKGMAHITGGGLVGNVPRVLPEGLAARFDSQSWTVPPLFRLIQQQGNIDTDEMYRVFNMGIGMVVICSPDDAGRLVESLPGVGVIGEVVKQGGRERVQLD